VPTPISEICIVAREESKKDTCVHFPRTAVMRGQFLCDARESFIVSYKCTKGLGDIILLELEKFMFHSSVFHIKSRKKFIHDPSQRRTPQMS
jgi:hypothetical protein